MAAITVLNVTEGEPNKSVIWPGKAGEAITAGDVVAYDISLNNNLLYQYDLADANQQSIHGVALDDAATGQRFRVLREGFLKGLVLDPGSVALHRTGNPVFTGAAGKLADTTAVGASTVGRIVELAGSVGLYVRPEFS